MTEALKNEAVEFEKTAEVRNSEPSKEAKEKNCVLDVEAVLKKYGMRLVATINHYQHLLLEKQFEKNPELIAGIQIKVVPDEK